MTPYAILSALLDYPQQELIDALPDIESALAAWPDARRELTPVLAALSGHSLIESQECYVATFDRNRSHSLHLFEHVHGESRERGQAMVDLLDEYRSHGFDVAANELPDYVPLFLEVLGLLDADQAQALLDEAIHVLAAVGERLARAESPYAGIFAVLRQLSRVQPQPLMKPPVSDMDEALEVFGVGPDGVEPLLTPSATQTIRFHPRGTATPRDMPPAHLSRGA
ncbi:nitrate reductase molybdenum cofactor assembly chaperone [Paraburkholderia sp. Tr-20389]|uniref:nitrate reductase molybdenum cofactor assembly chaperone n=1 Tax=Paraburkholderia sp. Tr-20389 TaxID=2703903 RepID=UPI0019818507|nr:nitrate reductase molybdenum cofactor assembly chaperone [Paraburkholderia sp. Tr-20389]MBN3757722.1 nitrate reductase molybdenum cofactor assembly chaperone [Paraburkholderia sp. Tr-20389]